MTTNAPNALMGTDEELHDILAAPGVAQILAWRDAAVRTALTRADIVAAATAPASGAHRNDTDLRILTAVGLLVGNYRIDRTDRTDPYAIVVRTVDGDVFGRAVLIPVPGRPTDRRWQLQCACGESCDRPLGFGAPCQGSSL